MTQLTRVRGDFNREQYDDMVHSSLGGEPSGTPDRWQQTTLNPGGKDTSGNVKAKLGIYNESGKKLTAREGEARYLRNGHTICQGPVKNDEVIFPKDDWAETKKGFDRFEYEVGTDST